MKYFIIITFLCVTIQPVFSWDKDNCVVSYRAVKDKVVKTVTPVNSLIEYTPAGRIGAYQYPEVTVPSVDLEMNVEVEVLRIEQVNKENGKLIYYYSQKTFPLNSKERLTELISDFKIAYENTFCVNIED